MESVLLSKYNNNTAITPPESLTPNSTTAIDEYDPEQEQTTAMISYENEASAEKNESQNNASLISMVTQLLPSPPPNNNDCCSSTISKKREGLVDQDLDKDKPPAIIDGCKWCQRCGTTETPRWRFGPGGPFTLCNACHLRWKSLGRPLDGYSSENFPPPFYNPNNQPIKRKLTKKKSTVEKENKSAYKRKRLSSPKTDKGYKRKRLASPPLEKESKKEKLTSPSPAIITNVLKEDNIPNTCTQCHTTTTSLWRKGPLGYKTLCNACGLRWAKNPSMVITRIYKKKEISKDDNVVRNNINNPPVKSTTKTVKKSTASMLLHQKKDYIERGLYSVENRVEKIEKPLPFSIPLPIHLGEYLISNEKDFELPCDILQERELGLIKGLMANRQPFFAKIRSNIFVERKPQLKPDEQAICHCVPPKDFSQKGCGDDCINRMLFYECDPKRCPCGTRCSNQRFQRKEKKKGLQIFQSDSRGWGLKTTLDIKKGELVIEYRGEIISHELCEERMCTTYVNEKNFYFLDYCNGEVIDACTKGTEARFINHSCEPNCHIEKWSLKGESHFGVFASQDIKAHSELFYDYNFSSFNDSVEGQQICHCGSKSCRGTIGKKSQMK